MRIINITDSLNANSFDNQHRIQTEAYDLVLNLIKDSAAKAQKAKTSRAENKTYHEHNSIFIMGNRGSGKTTFLLGTRRLIEENSDMLRDVFFLDVIDPTLMHDSDNFLSIVLGKIHEKVEEKCSDRDDCNYKAFIKSLSKVAAIIATISESKDSIGIDKILNEQNALKLEEEIHILLEKATDCLKCSLLILPIDDIDMAFKHGFDVLERIRKYLTSPCILPIISGDINLYKQVFAGKFYKQLAKKLDNAGIKDFEEKSEWLNSQNIEENDDNIGFVGRAISLSDFYMEKVLPRNRRIKLNELPDVDKNNVGLEINDGNVSLNEVVERITETFNLGIGKSFKRKISPFPYSTLRGFIHFLSHIEEFLPKDRFQQTNDLYITLKSFYKRIADFYKFPTNSGEKEIRDFALANAEAFSAEKGFSVKAFAQNMVLKKYDEKLKNKFGFKKIVPYITKDKAKFEFPVSDIGRLFFIISFEEDVKNGVKIFVSPDKFFIWLSSKLFSPEDIENYDGKKLYSFGFNNVLFMYDSNSEEISPESEIDPKGMDSYEKVKYQKGNTHLNIDIPTIKSILCGNDNTSDCNSPIRCSALLLWNVYRKYRENANAIVEGLGEKDEDFSIFVTRLIYAYVNALAIATIGNDKFSENNICLTIPESENVSPSEIKDYLSKYDTAYRWNIAGWSKEDNDNKIINLLNTLIKLVDTSKSGILLSFRKKQILTTLTSRQIKQRITNIINDLIKEKLNGVDFVEAINRSVNFEELKKADPSHQWFRARRNQIKDDSVYEATFGKYFKK